MHARGAGGGGGERESGGGEKKKKKKAAPPPATAGPGCQSCAHRIEKFREIHLVNSLLVAERVDRIEFCGARSGIKASRETDQNREANRARRQPKRHGRDLHSGKVLAFQIDDGAESERLADQQSEEKAKNAARRC